MKFRCASNAAIKNVKIARKKSSFFSTIFSTKSLDWLALHLKVEEVLEELLPLRLIIPITHQI